jgi:hypothetical protein
MSFSRGWDNNTPPPTRDADELDSIVRELKVDIHERLTATIFDNLPNNNNEADITLKDIVTGQKNNKHMLIHGSAFTPDSNSQAYAVAATGITVTAIATAFRARLILPPTTTITRIMWLVTGADTNAITLALKALAFDVGLGQVTKNSLSSTIAAVNIKDSGVVSIVVEDDEMLFLEFDKSTGATFQIHGVDITYSSPDSRFTL